MVELPNHPLVATTKAAADTAIGPASVLDAAITRVPDPDLVSVDAPESWMGLENVSDEEDCETETIGLVPTKVSVPPPIAKFALALVKLSPLAETPRAAMEMPVDLLVKRAVLVRPFVESQGVEFVVFQPFFVESQTTVAFVLVNVAARTDPSQQINVKHTTNVNRFLNHAGGVKTI
jgi:hypothetical protein